MSTHFVHVLHRLSRDCSTWCEALAAPPLDLVCRTHTWQPSLVTTLPISISWYATSAFATLAFLMLEDFPSQEVWSLWSMIFNLIIYDMKVYELWVAKYNTLASMLSRSFWRQLCLNSTLPFTARSVPIVPRQPALWRRLGEASRWLHKC